MSGRRAVCGHSTHATTRCRHVVTWRSTHRMHMCEGGAQHAQHVHTARTAPRRVRAGCSTRPPVTSSHSHSVASHDPPCAAHTLSRSKAMAVHSPSALAPSRLPPCGSAAPPCPARSRTGCTPRGPRRSWPGGPPALPAAPTCRSPGSGSVPRRRGRRAPGATPARPARTGNTGNIEAPHNHRTEQHDQMIRMCSFGSMAKRLPRARNSSLAHAGRQGYTAWSCRQPREAHLRAQREAAGPARRAPPAQGLQRVEHGHEHVVGREGGVGREDARVHPCGAAHLATVKRRNAQRHICRLWGH
jgi:hypothetical protein